VKDRKEKVLKKTTAGIRETENPGRVRKADHEPGNVKERVGLIKPGERAGNSAYEMQYNDRTPHPKMKGWSKAKLSKWEPKTIEICLPTTTGGSTNIFLVT